MSSPLSPDRAARGEISVEEALKNADDYLNTQEKDARERLGLPPLGMTFVAQMAMIGVVAWRGSRRMARVAAT